MIKNIKYANKEKTLIDLEFEHEEFGFIPYTLDLDDDEKNEVRTQILEELKSVDILEYVEVTKDIKDLKALKISDFKVEYLAEANKDFTYKNECYKAGEKSAAAIASSITLAKALGETNCFIVAKNDTKTKYSFDDVLELSALIAKQWRTNWFKYKALK